MTLPWYRRVWSIILEMKGYERWPIFLAAIAFGIALVGYLGYAAWLLITAPIFWIWGMVTGGAG